MHESLELEKSLLSAREGFPSEDGSRPPPSPLSGGYLLIVISEPQLEAHKSVILRKISKGKIYSIFVLYTSTSCLFHLDFDVYT